MAGRVGCHPWAPRPRQFQLPFAYGANYDPELWLLLFCFCCAQEEETMSGYGASSSTPSAYSRGHDRDVEGKHMDLPGVKPIHRVEIDGVVSEWDLALVAQHRLAVGSRVGLGLAGGRPRGLPRPD
jgi:hypothetical protein